MHLLSAYVYLSSYLVGSDDDDDDDDDNDEDSVLFTYRF
jgi:hypothetical protein